MTDSVPDIRRSLSGARMPFPVLLFLFSSLLLPAASLAQVHAIDTAQFIHAGIKVPDHPRILLFAGGENKIRENIRTSHVWAQIHANIMHHSDSLLSIPVLTRVLTGIRLLPVSRDCLYRIFHLAYAWRMTRDRKYFDRAEKELLSVCRFRDWHPQHYLDVAEMTTGVAIGYDWLYQDLSADSRKIIREAIRSKGVLTSYDTAYPSYRKWLSVTNNWNQVCNTGITYGALATFEDDPALAVKVVNRSIASIATPMRDYEPDGAFAEGYTYWGYGTMFNVLFLDALEKVFNSAFGLEQQAGFRRTAGYLENMVGPTGKCFNYSDAEESSIFQPAMIWFADKLKNHTLLWNERSLLNNDSSIRQMNDRLLPAVMIWGGNLDLQKIIAPENFLWTGGGKNPVALMRASWTDPETMFVGFKGGSPSVTHGHMDAGSFVLDALGVRWSGDLGMQDYNSLESKQVDLWNNKQNGQRWDVFRYRNEVHSTLTINSQLQRVDGYATVGAGAADSNFIFATSALSTLYAGQAVSVNRGIAICQKKYVLVQDEVETGDSAAVIRWSMLTSATVSFDKKNNALLRSHGKYLRIVVTGKDSVVMKTWTTDPPPHDYDESNKGTRVVGFETVVAAHTKRIFDVYLLPGNTVPDTVAIIRPLAQWK